jgi:sec-independent protein translocase protein TatC
VDRLARPKDDLFEHSTMTFGEHLEELRQSLGKAILWLMGGMLIGLYFADSVILYIQTPLESAIQQFRVDQDMHRLEIENPTDDQRANGEFLAGEGLRLEVYYEIPDRQQTPYLAALDGTADATATKDLFSDKSQLKRMVRFVEDKSGLSSLKIEEPFMIWVKAGLIVGAVIASPMIFYHLWAFVAAGLHTHERKYVYIYLPVSVVLFVSGVVLAFFLVLHYVLNFLLAFNGSMGVAAEPRLTYYVNFVLMLPLGFGIAFQLPLVMLFLQRIGLFETQAYIDSWKIAILVIFTISMLLTPADVTSMIALAIPLVFLYALGILMCMFIPRGRGMGRDAYDPA